MREGAQDYLVKGTVTVDTLERAMYYAIERKNLEEQLTQYLSTLKSWCSKKRLNSSERNAWRLSGKWRQWSDTISAARYRPFSTLFTSRENRSTS